MYYKEWIHPEANAAAFRPPMSIAAAGPSSECVEFAVKATMTNATAMAVAPLTRDAIKIVTISIQ